MNEISYHVGQDFTLEEATDLYRASTLGERRPIDESERFAQMLSGANLVITAWDGEILAGIARNLTDWVYVTYVADLAVRASHQKRGIGRELLRQTRLAAPQSQLVLLAAPKAETYYPQIGFAPHNSAWTLKPHEPL